MPQHATLTDQEALAAKRRFGIALRMLRLVDVYWLPESREVTARSVVIARRFRLPTSALFIGRYAHGGIALDDFVDDLRDLIAVAPRAATTAPDARELGARMPAAA